MHSLSCNYISGFAVHFLPLPFSLHWMNGECVMREQFRIHSEKLFCFNEMIEQKLLFYGNRSNTLIEQLEIKKEEIGEYVFSELFCLSLFNFTCLHGLVS